MATADITSVPNVGSPRFPGPKWQIPWEMLPMIVFTVALAAAVGATIFVPDSAKFAILIPAVVVLGLTAIVRPELALIASVAYTPFESNEFRPIQLPAGLTISKILGYTLLGVFFFNIIFRKRRFRFMDDSQDLAVILFAASMLFSGINSYFPAKTWDSTERMLRMFAFYFAVKNLISNFNVVKWIMWAITVTVTLATVWGINEFIQMSLVRVHDIRVRGVYMDINDYAALTVYALLIAVHLFEVVKTFSAKAFVSVCITIMLAGITLSASRSAFLAMAIALGIYILRHPRKQLLIAMSVAAVVISFPFLPESVKARFIGGDELGDNVYSQTAANSTERRASYVTFGIEHISEYPLLGAGYGTFSRLYPKSEFSRYEDNPMTDGERYRLAHNAYLEITFGVGLLGLACFLLLWIIALRDFELARRNAVRGTIRWGAANGFQLAMISLMLTSLFLSIEHFNYTWIGIAMSSALASYVRRKQANNAVVEAA
jgi:O-antigen ligase